MNNMKNNDPFKFPNSQSYSKLSLLSLPSSTSSCNNDANLSISNSDSQPHSQSQSNQSLLVENSEQSPINEMIRTAKLNAPLVIKRGPRGYGFTLRAIKVYFDDSDFYTIQHLVIQLDPQGPAFSAGLRLNDIITHVNDEIVCGKMHHEIVKSIMLSVNNTLHLHTIQLNDTSIKTGGRKRSPSKSKFTRPGFVSMQHNRIHHQQQHHHHHLNQHQALQNYQNIQFTSINNPASKLNATNSRNSNSKSLNNYYFLNQNQPGNLITPTNVNNMSHLHYGNHHHHQQQQQQNQFNIQHPLNNNLHSTSFHVNPNFYGNYSSNNYFNNTNQNPNYQQQLNKVSNMDSYIF